MNNKQFYMEHGWRSPFLSIHSKNWLFEVPRWPWTLQKPFQTFMKVRAVVFFSGGWDRHVTHGENMTEFFCFWLIHDTRPFIAAKGIMWIPYAQIIATFIIFHTKKSISPEIRATPILLAKNSARANKYRPQVRSWFFAFEILKKTWFANIPHVQTASFLGVLITAHEKYSMTSYVVTRMMDFI